MADEVLYSTRGAIALITLNRPRYRNAQNSAMTYALDAAFDRAVNDDSVAVIVLAGAGDHFSAGHDIGTPERDADTSFPPTLPYAADAEVAGLVLLAEPGGVAVAVRAEAHRSVDPTRSLSVVTGHDVLVQGANAGQAMARAFDLGVLACSAQLLGAGRALLEASVRHACLRTQFGQPRDVSAAKVACADAARRRPGRRSRCTGRSGTRPSTTSAGGSPRSARWARPGAARLSIASGSSARSCRPRPARRPPPHSRQRHSPARGLRTPDPGRFRGLDR
jgi:hypothetical protein